MNTQLMVIIIVAVVAIAGVALWLLTKRRSEHLRRRFGPEYDRVVRDEGNVRKAEAALQARATRVERLHIRPLSSEDGRRFGDRWRIVQAQFVDDPRGAVTQADQLIAEVMSARGYPVGDFEQRVEDISVDHPNVVMNYRAARDIADEHKRGQASTEDLRQAMVHYRALFSELLEEPAAPVQHRDVEPAAAAARRRE